MDSTGLRYTAMRTLSGIKADIGSTAGHLRPTPETVAAVEDHLASEGDALDDFFTFTVGDDIYLLLSHTEGEDDAGIHRLAWEAFAAGTDVAEDQGLYGAGQDILADAFAGNVKGLGPGACEMTFEEREAEPFLAFGMDKTEPGSFNQPMYSAFADPTQSGGLVLKDSIHEGFEFEILDMAHTGDGERVVTLDVPEDSWKLTALLMEPHRFGIRAIRSRHSGSQAAAISTQKLRNVAGKYVGKDDPVGIVRTQSNFLSPGEVLQPFAEAPLVGGAMRGSHHAPLYPVRSGEEEIPSYYDGPALVKAVGFVLNDGEFSDPVYPFDSSFWDSVRDDVSRRFREFRQRQGSFGPGTLRASELEYGGWEDVLESLEGEWESREAANAGGPAPMASSGSAPE